MYGIVTSMALLKVNSGVMPAGTFFYNSDSFHSVKFVFVRKSIKEETDIVYTSFKVVMGYRYSFSDTSVAFFYQLRPLKKINCEKRSLFHYRYRYCLSGFGPSIS
jgi:hypothetical protein